MIVSTKHWAPSTEPNTGHRPPDSTLGAVHRTKYWAPSTGPYTGHRPPDITPHGHRPPDHTRGTVHRTIHWAPSTGPYTGHRPPDQILGTAHRTLHWAPSTGTNTKLAVLSFPTQVTHVFLSFPTVWLSCPFQPRPYLAILYFPTQATSVRPVLSHSRFKIHEYYLIREVKT